MSATSPSTPAPHRASSSSSSSVSSSSHPKVVKDQYNYHPISSPPPIKALSHDKEPNTPSTMLLSCQISLQNYFQKHIVLIFTDKEHRRFFILRFCVLFCLLVTAVSIGFESFRVLSEQEQLTQREEYYAVARKIEQATLRSMDSRKDSMALTASLALHFCPNTSMWPNCAVPYNLYDSVASPLHRISLMRAVETTPIIQPSQLADYESFLYDFYVTKNNYPSGKIFSTFIKPEH